MPTDARRIPAPLLAAIAGAVSDLESHASMDLLFAHAGAPGEAPPGSKPAKAEEWLRRTNRELPDRALDVAGLLIEGYMEEVLEEGNVYHEHKLRHRSLISRALARDELQYVRGGRIAAAGLTVPSRILEDYIRASDLGAVDEEFRRAITNVDTSPREAVSAASNILETLCKVYIDDEGLDLPRTQDLDGVWTVVRKHLGFDAGAVEDQDLKRILSGLFGIVGGVGSLRTHASSAHGTGRRRYRLEPRHARLACHAAHTAALFVLETWAARRAKH